MIDITTIYPALVVVGFGSLILGIVIGIMITGGNSYRGAHEPPMVYRYGRSQGVDEKAQDPHPRRTPVESQIQHVGLRGGSPC